MLDLVVAGVGNAGLSVMVVNGRVVVDGDDVTVIGAVLFEGRSAGAGAGLSSNVDADGVGIGATDAEGDGSGIAAVAYDFSAHFPVSTTAGTTKIAAVMVCNVAIRPKCCKCSKIRFGSEPVSR